MMGMMTFVRVLRLEKYEQAIPTYEAGAKAERSLRIELYSSELRDFSR